MEGENLVEIESVQSEKDASLPLIQPNKNYYDDWLPELKPVNIEVMTYDIIKDALQKPQEPEDPNALNNLPKNIKRGRVAYKLDHYKDKSEVKGEELKKRMNELKAKGDKGWFRLRKQYLALRTRVNRRVLV